MCRVSVHYATLLTNLPTFCKLVLKFHSRLLNLIGIIGALTYLPDWTHGSWWKRFLPFLSSTLLRRIRALKGIWDSRLNVLISLNQIAEFSMPNSGARLSQKPSFTWLNIRHMFHKKAKFFFSFCWWDGGGTIKNCNVSIYLALFLAGSKRFSFWRGHYRPLLRSQKLNSAATNSKRR